MSEIEAYRPFPAYNPNTDDWDTLQDGALVVEGYSLLTTETCKRLIGVPMMVIRATYRDGLGMWDAKKEIRNDYVSLEAVVAPERILKEMARKGRINLDEIGVDPGENVVFNDGSTGIYRQTTATLHAMGAIQVTGQNPKLEGRSGESAFDQPRAAWVRGAEEATTGINMRLSLPRGLRWSEYENEYGEAETFYFG